MDQRNTHFPEQKLLNSNFCFNSGIAAIRQLMKDMDMPLSIKDAGIDEKQFMANVETLSEKAHDDQCTGANPKYPLVKEIVEIYKQAYYGK